MSYKEPKLPYELNEVLKLFRKFVSERRKVDAIDKVIEAFHSGQYWRDLQKKLPKHQIVTDTNYLEYIEKAITNSVYTGGFIANVMAKRYVDNEKAKQLNTFLGNIADQLQLKTFFPKLGKEATKFNRSFIQVGWDATTITGPRDSQDQGVVELKHIPAREVYLDSSVTNYIKGRAVFISKNVNLLDLLSEDGLREGAQAFLDKYKDKNGNVSISQGADAPKTELGHDPSTMQVHLIEAFYKTETGIDQIFILNSEFIIYYKKNIKPNEFPIIPLYGEDPTEDPYGSSLLSKVLYNTTAYNIISSLDATHIYISQNRPKLIDVSTGINYRSFAQYGNDPHKAWQVKGDPSKVVRYVDQQPLPNQLPLTKESLRNDIMLVTGVDLRYTGRDTGSIQTTGGTDLSQQRIISQTDNGRISALEIFTERLTKLIIAFYKENGTIYHLVKRNSRTNEATELTEGQDQINFRDYENLDFDFSLNAEPFLPKNRMRLAEAANRLIEMQGQYNFQPAIITHEEWLSFQDFPQKDILLERLRADQMKSDEQDLVNTLMNFAGLIDKGLEPEEAIQIIVEEKQMLRDNPSIAQTANKPLD